MHTLPREARRRLSEAQLLGLARVVSVGVVLTLIFFVVVIDPSFVHPQRATDDVVLSILGGALFGLLGIVAIERAVKANPGHAFEADPEDPRVCAQCGKPRAFVDHIR